MLTGVVHLNREVTCEGVEAVGNASNLTVECTVEAGVTVVACVLCFVVLDGTTGKSNFLQSCVKRAIGVTHVETEALVRQEPCCATIVGRVSSVRLVELNSRTEREAAIRLTCHCECDFNVCVELCFDVITAEDTDFSGTRDRHFGSCDADRCYQCCGSKKKLFHFFPHEFVR